MGDKMNFSNLNKIMLDDSGWKNKQTLEIKEGMAGMQDIQPMGGQSQGVEGNLNVQKLSKYLPSQDPMKLKTVISIVSRGGKLNNLQLISLGNAFIDILKANSQETVQIMNLIKRVAAEPENTGLTAR
jgi:hypothetical protein